MAIGTPTAIGQNSTKGGGTSFTLTTDTAVNAGDSVIVVVATNANVNPTSMTDDAGNTYTRAVGAAGNSVYSGIFFCHNVAAMPIGTVITINWAASWAVQVLKAFKVTGLTNAAEDVDAGATGSGTSPSSGNTATTSQNDELLIGNIGITGPDDDATWTPGTNWNDLGKTGTTGSSPTSNRALRPEYRIVAATGAFAATGTITSRGWTATIAAFKGAAAAGGTPRSSAIIVG